MTEAFFMLFVLPGLIYGAFLVLAEIVNKPTDSEKSHYYAMKEYERRHPEDKVNTYSDMYNGRKNKK